MPPMTKRQREMFSRGIELFNNAQYFEAHEVLEELWKQQFESDRQLTQAIIQTAVALYHHGRDNFIGAAKLYERALRRLTPFGAVEQGIDTAQLSIDIEALRMRAMRNKPPDKAPKLHLPRA
jgi:predicted metal-dependent hydrolase